MRIAATFLIGAALITGCSTSQPSSGGSSSSSSAKPAKAPQPYFEMTGADGQTYVFGSADSLMAYQQKQQLPPMTTHYNKGKAVQVEEAHSSFLISEYDSQHK